MTVDFHFLNVGDGDCIIVDIPERVLRSDPSVEFPARMMMIDTHHHDDHDDYEDVVRYYLAHFSDSQGRPRPLFRYIQSHPHTDHLKGLSRLSRNIPIVNFWDLEHSFVPQKNGPGWDECRDDWECYERLRTGSTDPKVLRYSDADSPREYWKDDGITILSPSKDLHTAVHKKDDGTLRSPDEIGQELNDLSYVLLMKVNNLKILLAGDAEQRAWNHMIQNHRSEITNIDILKAPHHGRERAFKEEAVKIMRQKHIIMSASEECEYMVPEKYLKASPTSKIYKTCEQGTFVMSCDFDGGITLRRS